MSAWITRTLSRGNLQRTVFARRRAARLGNEGSKPIFSATPLSMSAPLAELARAWPALPRRLPARSTPRLHSPASPVIRSCEADLDATGGDDGRRNLRPHRRPRTLSRKIRSNSPRAKFPPEPNRSTSMPALRAFSQAASIPACSGFRSRPTRCRSTRFISSKPRGPARKAWPRCSARRHRHRPRGKRAPRIPHSRLARRSHRQDAPVGRWRFRQPAAHRRDRGRHVAAHLESDFAASSIVGDGEWRLADDYPGSATIRFSKVDLAQLRAWLAPTGSLAGLNGAAEASLRLDGPALNPRAMKAELRITRLEFAPAASTGLAPELSRSATPATSWSRWPARPSPWVSAVHRARYGFQRHRPLALDRKSPLDLRIGGHADLKLVRDLNRDLIASGSVKVDASVRGSLGAPQVTGRVEFANAGFNISDVPNGISNANGVLLFTGDRASIQSFTGETGGGKIELSGFAAYGGDGPTVFRLAPAPPGARALSGRRQYRRQRRPALQWTNDSSILSGTITVLRTGFNPQSDFSSLLAQSSEPVAPPPARTGLLGGLTYDIQIATAPISRCRAPSPRTSRWKPTCASAAPTPVPPCWAALISRTARWSSSAPGTTSQGSVSFFNPVNVEPVLDIDLETKARGIQVTLNVSGPLSKLNLTPRSDPPLQFSEIVALLATGRTPTTKPRFPTARTPPRPPGSSPPVRRCWARPFRQPRHRPPAALLRRQPSAHRSHSARHRIQRHGARHPGTAGDSRHHLHLHYRRHHQQPAGRECRMGLRQEVVGGSGARRKRPDRHGHSFQEAFLNGGLR
jgi:hypothetical protein